MSKTDYPFQRGKPTTAVAARRTQASGGNRPASGIVKFRQGGNLSKIGFFVTSVVVVLAAGWYLTVSVSDRIDSVPPVAWQACLQESTDGTFYPDLVTIPAGVYSLPAEAKQIAPFLEGQQLASIVIEKSFLMQKAEVTQAQFQRYVNFVQGLAKGTDRDQLAMRLGLVWNKGNKNTPLLNGLSWEAAWDYAQWLSQQTGCNYQLPSREEWAAAVIFFHGLAAFPESAAQGKKPLASLLGGVREWTRSQCDMGYHLVGEDDWIEAQQVGREICLPAMVAVAGFRVVLQEPELDKKSEKPATIDH